MVKQSGATYAWSPSAGLSATNIPNPIASPSATTNYVLTVTSANGCESTDSVLVTVLTNVIGDTTILTACDSTVWHGNTYTTSGLYTDTLSAANFSFGNI